jgi:hypothetical protein
MSAIAQEVRPAGARFEAWALVAATLVVIGILAWYVQMFGREEGMPKLYDWQISAFDGLSGADQAIFNSLYTVKDEIPLIYDDINQFNEPGVKFHWPDLQDFEDFVLPPFVKDTSWEQQGSLMWTLFEPLAEGEMQGSTMYLGTDGTLPMQGSFLLIIGHVHAGFTNNNSIVIWWNAKNHVEMPQSGFRDQLILAGWREVVVYSGDLEVKRLFGDPTSEEGADGGAGEQSTEDIESVLDGVFGDQ